MKKLLVFLIVVSFRQLQGQTLTNAQVYDFTPGDVFQWNHTDYYNTPWGASTCWLPSITTKHTDSIVSKNYSAASDTVFYTVYEETYTPTHCNPTLPPSYSSATITRYYSNLNALVFDTTAAVDYCMPDVDSFYVAYCGRNVWQHHNPNDTCFENPVWDFVAIEGCGRYGNYFGGIGGDAVYGTELIYYKKSGISCGSYSTTEIKERTITAEIDLYPNPNNGEVNFRYSMEGSDNGELIIYDFLGKVVYKFNLQHGTRNQLHIDISALNSGIYFYKMVVHQEVTASDKIVIIK